MQQRVSNVAVMCRKTRAGRGMHECNQRLVEFVSRELHGRQTYDAHVEFSRETNFVNRHLGLPHLYDVMFRLERRLKIQDRVASQVQRNGCLQRSSVGRNNLRLHGRRHSHVPWNRATAAWVSKTAMSVECD